MSVRSPFQLSVNSVIALTSSASIPVCCSSSVSWSAAAGAANTAVISSSVRAVEVSFPGFIFLCADLCSKLGDQVAGDHVG